VAGGRELKIERAAVEDAAVILALQHLAYRSEAGIYSEFTCPQCSIISS
jgi:hypothetical protein